MKPHRLLYILLITLGLSVGIMAVQHTRGTNHPATIATVDFNKVSSKILNTAEKHTQQTLRIAVAAMTSPHATKLIYHDLLNYIGDQLDMKLTFIQRATYAEIIPLLRTNKIDLAFICSGTYALCNDEFGWELLAIPVINSKKTYTSNIIVATASPYTTFADLRNKSFAFTCAGSNSGELYPKYYLLNQGETAQHFFSNTLCSHGNDNSIRAVASGLVEGAAIDSLILKYMIFKNDPAAQQVRIIHSSPEFGIPPVTVSPQLDPRSKERLRQLFLSVHKTQQGKKILDKLQIDYFTQGVDADYDSIREMIAACKKHEQ